MLYQDAKTIRESKLSLIGTKDKKGFVISDIIIVPIDEQSRQTFVQDFLKTRNFEVSIQPYITEDVVLWVIDTEYLDNANVLFYDVLE